MQYRGIFIGHLDQLHAEADLTLKCAGFSLMGEVLYRQAVDGPVRTETIDGVTVTERARDGLGGMAQVGYLVPRVPFEIAARWAELFPLGDDSAMTARRELTGGVGYYFLKQDLKLQADYGRLTSESAPGQHQIRAQAQVAF